MVGVGVGDLGMRADKSYDIYEHLLGNTNYTLYRL